MRFSILAMMIEEANCSNLCYFLSMYIYLKCPFDSYSLVTIIVVSMTFPVNEAKNI